jgi:hypothetical protein
MTLNKSKHHAGNGGMILQQSHKVGLSRAFNHYGLKSINLVFDDINGYIDGHNVDYSLRQAVGAGAK